MVACPTRGENFISIGPDLSGKIFEINPQLLEMLKKNTFWGEGSESPYKHIKAFQFACGTFQLQDLTNEEIKVKLFPYALGKEAAEWTVAYKFLE